MDGIQVFTIIFLVFMGIGLLSNINNAKYTGWHPVTNSLFMLGLLAPIIGRVFNWW